MNTKKICIYSLPVFGAFVIAAGILIHHILQSKLTEGIATEIQIVPGGKSQQYDSWADDTVAGAPPDLFQIWFWNITNGDHILHSNASDTVPIVVDKIGPFVWQKHTARFDNYFSSDQTKVTFYEQQYYLYRPELSVPFDPDTTMIAGPNPSYLGAVNVAGSESNLLLIGSSGALAQIMATMYSDFLPGVQVQSSGLVFLELASKVNIDFTQDANLAIWANATTPPSPEWDGLLLSQASGIPSELPLSTARLLFDPVNDPYAIYYFLPHSDPNVALVWFNVLSNATLHQQLEAYFQISASQLDIIINWLAAFRTQFVQPWLITNNHISQLDDLIFLQWGSGGFATNPIAKSIRSSSPIPLPGYPEFYYAECNGVYSTQCMKLGVNISRALAFGAKPLTDLNNCRQFLTLAAAKDYTTVQAEWGLQSPAQVDAVFNYMKYLGATFVNDTISQLLLNNNGPIVYHTVNQWVFNYTDPLLVALGANGTAAMSNYFINQTSKEDARAAVGVYTIYTGVGDASKTQLLTRYNGSSVISGIWQTDEVISGTEGYQFSPSLSQSDSVFIFDTNTQRVVQFDSNEKTSVFGIELLRYRVASEALGVNPKYYQIIPGFANMTSFHQGAPIFLSRPNFYGCDPAWQQKVLGMDRPTPDLDDLIIDVEPITGISMNYRRRLQINIYVAEDLQFDVWFPTLPKNIFYPSLYVEEKATVSEAQANQFKSSVYLVLTLKQVVMYACIAVGSFIVVIGCFFIFRLRQKDLEYMEIQ